MSQVKCKRLHLTGHGIWIFCLPAVTERRLIVGPSWSPRRALRTLRDPRDRPAFHELTSLFLVSCSGGLRGEGSLYWRHGAHLRSTVSGPGLDSETNFRFPSWRGTRRIDHLARVTGRSSSSGID